MIKKLDTYMWRELIVPFLIGTVAVGMMFMVNQLMAIMKEIDVQGVPALAIFLSIIYKVPFWMTYTLPIGVSVGASLAFTRLARESELTAMRASGTPYMRIMYPVAMFGLVVAIGNFLLVEKVVPRSEKKFVEIARKVGILGLMPQPKPNTVVYLRDYTASFGSVIRAGDTLQLQNAVLFQRKRADETLIFSAPSGTYKDGVWTLSKPYAWLLNGLTLTGVRPQKEDLVIDQRIIIDDLLTQRTEESQTAAELLDAIRNGRKAGLVTTELEVAYHNRFSGPASCIVFALVAPIFAILFSRTGGFAGVLLSLLLVMLYYNAYVVCSEIVGRNGWLPPFAAAWLPNVFFAVIGYFALRRLG